MSLPIVETLDPTADPTAAVAQPARPAATRLGCLRCQLLGHRNLLCRQAESCKSLPHSFMLGPVLILGWLATAIAFVVAISR